MKPESVKLGILMVLLAVLGWVARGGYEAVYHTRRCIALYRQAGILVHNGREDLAIPLLEQATIEDPHVFEVWEMLAQAEYSKHDRSRTILIYEEAHLYLPEDPRVDQHLADMYALDGQYDLALEALGRIRDRVGPDVTLMKAIDRVQRWKANPPTHKT